MIINSANVRGMSIGYKTIFNKALETTETMWDKVATEVPSTTGSETYAWLGSFPKLKEWIGARQIKNLSTSDYTIKNKPFESTVGVPREAVEDDQYGIYNPMMEDMGSSAAQWPEGLVFELMKKGFTEKCYDGKTFYATDHKVGKLTFSNKGTAALSLESYAAARAAMMSLMDEEGKSLKIIPNLLVVPPSLEGMARKILFSDQIDGTTNTMKGTAELLVVPDLAGDDKAWHLICNKKSVRPFIFQKRSAPKFTTKTNENDDNVFFNKEFIYGTDARGNAGFGLWQLAYGSTGAAN